jgi:hypothetical protein
MEVILKVVCPAHRFVEAGSLDSRGSQWSAVLLPCGRCAYAPLLAVYAHALPIRRTCLVIACHVIIASDLVILTSCLRPSISCACCIVRSTGPLSRRNVFFRAVAGMRIASPRSFGCRLLQIVRHVDFEAEVEAQSHCFLGAAIATSGQTLPAHVYCDFGFLGCLVLSSRRCRPRTPDPSMMVCVGGSESARVARYWS